MVLKDIVATLSENIMKSVIICEHVAQMLTSKQVTHITIVLQSVNIYLHQFITYIQLNQISKRMRWVGYIACMEDMINAYEIVFEELEGNRPRCGLLSKKIMREDVEWIHLARDRVHNWVLVNMIK
jgi:hypothetical protein